MFSIAVCDDCPRQTQTLLAMLDSYSAYKQDIEIYCKSFSSGHELSAALDGGEVFDLFLLDIIMPGQSGIELARSIRVKNADAPIIFLTTSPDYALEAFDVSAAQYILKPIDTNRLFFSIDKILNAVEAENNQYLMFPSVSSVVKVPYASIICIELFSRAMKLYQTNGTILISKTIRVPFYEAIDSLLLDGRFLCPHKSYVINMAWVEELTSKSFVMKQGLYIPIPRYRYAKMKAEYFGWLSRRGIIKLGVSRND